MIKKINVYFISTVDNYNVHTDMHIDINTNLNVLMDVLKSFRESSPDAVFNFISSWFVYGNVPLPAKEDSHCNPRGFYSITKRAAEQMLISYCETFGLNDKRFFYDSKFTSHNFHNFSWLFNSILKINFFLKKCLMHI